MAALETIADPAFLAHGAAMGARLRDGLERRAARHPHVRQVRGLGLMQGLLLDGPGGAIVTRCLEAGLLVNCTADRVLRMTPPLIVTADEVDEALEIVDGALAAA